MYTLERLKNCMDLGFIEVGYENIDEGMIPILTELNEKGYITEHSCEGHVKDGFFDTYISFLNPHGDFDDSNLEYSKKDVSRIITTYRWTGVFDNDEDAEKCKQEVLEYLGEWSKGLPVREKKYFMVGWKGDKSKWLGKKIKKDEVERIKKETDGKYDWYDVWEERGKISRKAV